MSAPPLTNTFDGGSDGVTLTQAITGNTGGASGDFFNSVSIGAGVTMQFSRTVTRALRQYSMKVVQANPGVASAAKWTGLGSITTDVWTRQYFNVSTVSVANLMLAYVTASSASVGYFGFNATAHVIGMDGAGSTISGLTSTATLSINTWYRLETRCVPSTTAGQMEWWLYDASDTLIENKSLGSLVLGGANVDQLSFGHGVSAATTVFNAGTGYTSDVAASKVGQIGPSVALYQARGIQPLLATLTR